jgi:hypothetical protein
VVRSSHWIDSGCLLSLRHVTTVPLPVDGLAQGVKLPDCSVSPDNQDGKRDNQDGKFLRGLFSELLARI